MSGGLSRLADVLAQDQQPQDTYGTATYLRTDSDGTAWVRLAGSDTETPANGGTTVDAKEGDTVTVRQDGTRLYIMGNGTAPAVGVRQVAQMILPVQEAVGNIVGSVSKAVTDSAAAQKIAEAVAAVAEATSQHFWTDDSGVHVTQVTQDAWEQSGGEHYHSGPNVLINALGQLFRDGMNNLLTLTTENGARALTIWDGLGNAAGNVRAVIGETITLGGSGENHVVIDANGFDYFNSNNYRVAHMGNDVRLSPMGGGNGLFMKATSEGGIGLSLSNQQGGSPEFPSGKAGNYSIAAGKSVSARRMAVEGGQIVGLVPVDVGTDSTGSGSIAVGHALQALSDYQAVFGRMNVPDENGDYVLIVGNGHAMTHEEEEEKAQEVGDGSFINIAHSNALTVDWNGTIETHKNLNLVSDTANALATTRSADSYESGIYAFDKNGNRVFYCETMYGADGRVQRSFAVQRDSVTNGLWFWVNADGTRGMSLSDAAMWRTALGLTDSQATVPLAGVTASTSIVRKYGNVVTLTLNNVMPTSAIATGTYKIIATIPSGYRPVGTNVYASAVVLGEGRTIMVNVETSGNVLLYNYTGSSITTSNHLYITCTYVL